MSNQFPTYAEAQKFTARYVCSVCWGHLLIDQDNNVSCARYGDEHAGYVTAHYRDRRKGDSIGERCEVDELLIKVGIKERRDPDDILKDLGF